MGIGPGVRPPKTNTNRQAIGINTKGIGPRESTPMAFLFERQGGVMLPFFLSSNDANNDGATIKQNPSGVVRLGLFLTRVF